MLIPLDQYYIYYFFLNVLISIDIDVISAASEVISSGSLLIMSEVIMHLFSDWIMSAIAN